MSTIKSSREIDTIFRTATRVAHPLLIALIAQTPEGRGPSGRVAFIAGKKLGNAVYGTVPDGLCGKRSGVPRVLGQGMT